MSSEFQNEQALLQQLRHSGDPASVHNADQLPQLYHHRQMVLLSADVYHDAEGVGTPPPGWTRLSEHPELVRQFATQLHVSNDQLLGFLKPLRSGFRAEIYLPDPAVLGPGYKPTAAFKSSSGQVFAPNGLPECDVQHRIATHHVKDSLLNQGTQNNSAHLDDDRGARH